MTVHHNAREFPVLGLRDETGSRVNGSLGRPIQNLGMGQLGPGSKFKLNCNKIVNE